MLACVDVDYRSAAGPAVAAAVVIESWTAAASVAEHVVVVEHIEPYVPGQFYRRELPCIRALLAEVEEPVDAIVIDGHVWLDDRQTPGLGAHLHRALGGAVAIVGVAKNAYHSTESAAAVLRGASSSPLYVTTAGIDRGAAQGLVQRMAGEHRIPTVLKRVDRLCRDYQITT